MDGKVQESGTWHDSDGTWGTYGYDADVKEVVNTEGSCPAIGQERDEPWVESWEVKKGCPKPICPEPMLSITDKWTRVAGRTKKNGVTIKAGFQNPSFFPSRDRRGTYPVHRSLKRS